MLSSKIQNSLSCLLCLFLVSFAIAIPPIQTSVIKGTIHQAGVRCICPIESAQVSAHPMCPTSIPLPPNYYRPGYALTDSNGSFSISVAGCKVWRISVTHDDFDAIDTIFLLDSNYNANLGLYMWAETAVDPKIGPEWLSIGYPQQWYFVQMPSPDGYYGTLYADATQKTRLRDLYSSTLDLGIFNGKLSKVRGQIGIIDAALPAKRALTPPEPKLIASKADLAQKDRVLIGYVHNSGPVSPQSQFMNMLSIDEVGHVTYTENPCPMCDYLPMPKVDTIVSIEKVNALVDLFNSNGFWGFDTIVRPMPLVIGGQSYSLTCDGTNWQVYSASEQEKAIIDGMEAFIKEITTPAAIRMSSSGALSLSGQVNQKGGSIRFAASGTGPIQVSVYDLSGRLLHASRPNLSNFSLPTEELMPGIYLARMIQGSHETVSRFAVVP